MGKRTALVPASGRIRLPSADLKSCAIEATGRKIRESDKFEMEIEASCIVVDGIDDEGGRSDFVCIAERTRKGVQEQAFTEASSSTDAVNGKAA